MKVWVFFVFCPNASFVCVLTWGCSRGRSEKENDREGEGCKSTTRRTKGRTGSERDGGAAWVCWLYNDSFEL